jgi:hypothetical protein
MSKVRQIWRWPPAWRHVLPMSGCRPRLHVLTWVPPTHHLSVWRATGRADLEKATAGRVKVQELLKAPLRHLEPLTRCGWPGRLFLT